VPVAAGDARAPWARGQGALDPEDQKLIDEAAANVAGIAAFALLGLGFFTWNDARETLAELRKIRVAISEGEEEELPLVRTCALLMRIKTC
jgi:hypothetical protein